MAGPEDEFQDELNDENPAASSDSSPSDSGLDLAPDVAMAPEAGGDDDEYTPDVDDDAPAADLSRELAEDAGDQASYGFEAARETVRFTAKEGEVDPDLTEATNTPDESDRFRPVELPDEPAPQFAEELGSPSDSYRLEDDPAASHSELKYTDDPPHLDEPVDDAPVESSPADSGIHYAEGAPEPEYADAEPEPEPPPPPKVKAAARPAAPPKPTTPTPRPAPAPSAPAPSTAADASGDDKPGAVRRSAIDEMFARAAELKRRKGE